MQYMADQIKLDLFAYFDNNITHGCNNQIIDSLIYTLPLMRTWMEILSRQLLSEDIDRRNENFV